MGNLLHRDGYCDATRMLHTGKRTLDNSGQIISCGHLPRIKVLCRAQLITSKPVHTEKGSLDGGGRYQRKICRHWEGTGIQGIWMCIYTQASLIPSYEVLSKQCNKQSGLSVETISMDLVLWKNIQDLGVTLHFLMCAYTKETSQQKWSQGIVKITRCTPLFFLHGMLYSEEKKLVYNRPIGLKWLSSSSGPVCINIWSLVTTDLG